MFNSGAAAYWIHLPARAGMTGGGADQSLRR